MELNFKGIVGKEPEILTTKSGKKMASFSVASKQKQKTGEDKTIWIQCNVLNEKIITSFESDVLKGRLVDISGSVIFDEYINKNNEKIFKIIVFVNKIVVSEKKNKANYNNAEIIVTEPLKTIEEKIDDLPF